MLERDPLSKVDAWRKDIVQIKKLGFNTVRCWIDWASGEPDEGRYQFQTIDVILKLAEEQGLKVIVQVYMDSAPSWVGRKYPDSLFVSSNGEAIHPESAPGYCVDNPGVHEEELKFYTALAQDAKKSPAFLGWDLWSEPHVINWATPTYIYHPEFCFCKYSIARFRSWLKKKYGSLDKLNDSWYRQYTAWDQVEPNRLSTILSYTDFIDWKEFIVYKLGQDLRDRYEAVKRVDPNVVATSHAAGIGLFSSPLWWEGQPDDWTMTSQVDYYGTSFYPKHSSFVNRDVQWRGALLDFTRSFGFANGGRGFWIGELQGGFGTVALNVSPTVTPEDIRDWTWSALSRGAKAINYYAWYPMSTGYESGGFGLIKLDGTHYRAKPRGRIDCKGCRPQSENISRSASSEGGSGDRLQPAFLLCGRAAAPDRLRGPSGRGGRDRARFDAWRVSRAISHERAGRFHSHQSLVANAVEAVQARHIAVSAHDSFFLG